MVNGHIISVSTTTHQRAYALPYPPAINAGAALINYTGHF